MTDVYYATDLYSFQCVLEEYRSTATVAVMKLYTGIIDMILVVYQGFQEIMERVWTLDLIEFTYYILNIYDFRWLLIGWSTFVRWTRCC